MDLPHVDHVLSYDAPVDMAKYVHRVGRTARAGREGDAWTLVEKQEARYFRAMLERSARKAKVKKLPALEDDQRQRLEAPYEVRAVMRPTVALLTPVAGCAGATRRVLYAALSAAARDSSAMDARTRTRLCSPALHLAALGDAHGHAWPVVLTRGHVLDLAQREQALDDLAEDDVLAVEEVARLAGDEELAGREAGCEVWTVHTGGGVDSPGSRLYLARSWPALESAAHVVSTAHHAPCSAGPAGRACARTPRRRTCRRRWRSCRCRRR